MVKKDLEEMVKTQIIDRKIGDEKIHKAFLEVDRIHFVPEAYRGMAYEDHPLSIGYGQTISQPAMVAEMLYEAQIEKGMKVLEIGSGSGYVLALLYKLGAIPYGVERIEELAKRIKENLKKAGIPEIPVKIGDGAYGFKEFSPYDRIIISAATNKIPEPLFDQLKVGGLLVAPVGGDFWQKLTIFKKEEKEIKVIEKGGCVFVPLITDYN